MAEITPFRIDVADAVLEDLRARLRATRWPERETVDDWTQGIPLAYVQELCSYWAEQYDWRAREAHLNGFPQYRTTIDGLGIHFMHVPSPHPQARPLVLTHGWPGSVVEFHKVIRPLSDPVAHGGRPEDAFHVVCPSLPGYGFSDKPATTGYGVERVARMWSELMQRLGYDRYFAQGGDWGSAVTSAIGALDAEHCMGIHTNMPTAGPGRDNTDELTPFEQHALERRHYYNDWDSGYSKQQSTRPQTLGYGLVDSPAAQAAWIIEKFWAWTDNNGHPEDVLTRDELLDNVMLYWVPGNGASSARLYWESFNSGFRSEVAVPTGATVFPREIVPASRRWAERRYRHIVYWNEVERGGHFAAFEQPELFVAELRACFDVMR